MAGRSLGVFIAHQIEVGRCGDPDCRCVHFSLMDEFGEVRAQAAVGIETIGELSEDILETTKEILRADAVPAPVGHA